MPVAVPYISNPSAANNNNNTNPTISITNNGFITREFNPVEIGARRMMEDDEEEEDYSGDEVNDVDDDETEEDSDDYGGSYEVESYLPRDAGLFEEYFDYAPSVTSRDRSCNHQLTSRPCPFCAPKVSMRLANEVRIAFKALFNFKVIKFNYVPLDKVLVESPFKALKALHDLGYIKKILNEIINLLATIQNIPEIKMSYIISSAILRIHDRIEGIIDDIRASGKSEELLVVLEFRTKLNSIGIIQGGVGKENFMNENLHHPLVQECQR